MYKGEDEDLRKILVLREPHSQLALVQGCDAIQPAQRIEDASLKEDGAWTCSVMNKVIDVFTHRGWFAVKFLWPLSPYHVDGLPWETPWFLAANWASLAAVWLLMIVRMRLHRSRA